MIKKLFIHRFRGIRQGRIDNLRRFNVFIGPNNSGKTAVLELLYLSATSGRPAQFVREDLMNAEDEARARVSALEATTSAPDLLGQAPLPCLRQRHNAKPEWKKSGTGLTRQGGIRVELDLPSWPGFLLAAPPPEPNQDEDKLIFKEKDCAEIALFTLPKPEYLDNTMVPPYLREQGLHPPDADWHYLWEDTWVYRWEQNSDIDKLAVWATQGQRPAPKHVISFNFNTIDAHLPAHFVKENYHRILDWWEKIAAQLTKVFPSLEGAKIEMMEASDGQPGYAGYVRFPGKAPLPIDQLGDGARHAFKLLTALVTLRETVSDERPGMLLWEEPEVFNNPATLTRLLTVVVDMVKDKPIQVFLATHSIELLAHFTRLLQQEYFPSAEALAFLFDLRDGVFKNSWFDVHHLTSWLESGLDPRILEDFEAPLQFQLRHEDEYEGIC